MRINRSLTWCMALTMIVLCGRANAALVAYWDLEEGSGLTTRDQINGNDDPLIGTTWVTNVADLPPVPSGTTAAMLFTRASSTYIDTAFDGVGGTEARTIALWVKLTDITDTAATQGLVTYGARDGDGRKWHVRINNSSGGTPPRIPGAVRTEAASGNQTGTTNLSDGQWHHVASVFPGGAGSNNTDVFHYVDGILEGETGTTDEPIDTGIGGTFPKVILGARRQTSNATTASTPTSFLNGMMDDVRFYDHALSAGEVQFLIFGTAGDVNGDELVNEVDLDIINMNLYETMVGGMPVERTDGDLNLDGIVDHKDYRLWTLHSSLVGAGSIGAGPVPEPASLGIALLGAVALLGIRRRI